MATWNWALDFQPVDKDGGPNPAPVPVSRVRGASIKYGVSGDQLGASGGTMVLELDNTDSAFTPDGGGTYENARFLNVLVKLYADVTGAGAPSWTHGPPAVFTGVVSDVQFTYSDTYDATVKVTVVDLLTMLGTLVLDREPVGFELDSATDGILDTSTLGFDLRGGLSLDSNPTAVVIDQLLAAADAVSPQVGQTSVVNPQGDTGETLQAITDYLGTAGALLNSINATTGSSIYVRHGLPVDGTHPYNSLTFRARGREPLSDAVTGVIGFTPLNLWDARLATSGTEPHYISNVELATGSTSSYTQALYTRAGGEQQRTSSGLDEFGGRSISRSDLLNLTDERTLAAAEAFLAEYGADGAPPLNVREVRMLPIVTGDNDGWQLTKHSTGETTTLSMRPEGSTSTLQFTGVVVGVSWAISPKAAQMTVQIDQAQRLVHFTLDSSDYGELDTDTLGY